MVLPQGYSLLELVGVLHSPKDLSAVARELRGAPVARLEDLDALEHRL
eukprot:CAMPEP_0180490044 /NCGR_PEP_ID=MMETSP1036_2-20121128/38909_1 /TAXON_ID=632150 /ORGANISM="Azadinium spinosum, Strain 3D9" /LENGTH=47 /DNA_ID= /DNA_START= /DNA_END= /DNA_ORIENTATION=